MNVIKSGAFIFIKYISYLLILICAYLLFNNFFNSFYRVCEVNIKMNSEYAGQRPVEIYYLINSWDDYVPENMVGITEENMHFSYDGSIELPVKSISGFKIDLGNMPDGKININKVSFRDYTGYADISLQQLSKCPMNHLEIIGFNSGELQLVVTGDDAYIEIKDLQKIPYKNYSNIYSAIAAVIITLIIYRYIRLKAVYTMFIELIQSRKLIFSLAKNDFRTKYAGSYFGILWAFVQPICTILVFWFVFQVGFKSTDVGNVPFICWFICGLVPWFFFSEAWGSATNCLVEYSFLVKKVVFKVHILPLVKIISAFFVHLFFIVFMMCVFFFYKIKPDISWIQVVYYCFCMVVLTISLSFITAPLVVFFKDLGQIMNIILQFGMWLTPIMWSIDLIPERFMGLFKLNPMYYIVQGYRDSFIYDVPFYNNIKQTLYFWLIAGAMMLLGCILFRKLKPHFADVL